MSELIPIPLACAFSVTGIRVIIKFPEKQLLFFPKNGTVFVQGERRNVLERFPIGPIVKTWSFSTDDFSMNEASRITFWFFVFWKLTALCSQEADYLDSESKPPEFIQLIDDRPLILNESYCLKQITVKTIPNSYFDDHNRSSYYFKIMWDSTAVMTSIKVESDSLNDSYCEAENKHYYYRKPLHPTFHVFPDEVHEGIRFLPIKLDCKYIITPELDGACRALKLRYSTPECVNDTCTCRNVNISGPILEGEWGKDGINVFWSFPENFKNIKYNVSSTVISIYSEDGINIKKLLKRKLSITDFTAINSIIHKQYFQINTTSETLYRIRGYFENKIHCRGNSTFLLLRRASKSGGLDHENVMGYTTGSLFLLIFMGLLYLKKNEVKRIYKKLFSSKSTSAPDFKDSACREIKLPTMTWNPTYENRKDLDLLDYRDFVIVREVASGNFGIVYLAYSDYSLRGCNEFAIKQIKDKAGAEGVTDFLEEIDIFKRVGYHQNVVEMFGYCKEPLSIIMEYVPFNLLTYLKNLRSEFERKKLALEGSTNYAELAPCRVSSESLSDYNYISQHEVECTPLNNGCKSCEPEYVLDNRELEIFGLQIARGMAHLECRNIIHRDLAARNVLMDNQKVLKISDFGMSRTGIYVNKRSRKFPLRWMSPEALVNRVYSNKSDVWSFGVVLWEIGTLGAFPYSSLQNEEVISLLKKGGHLDKPDNITAQLYSLMVDCWARSPDDRPAFKNLVEKIEGFCQKSNGYVEFENLESNYVFPPMEEDIKRKTEA